MPIQTVRRVAVDDHLRAVNGSEHTPESRQAAQIPHLKAVATSLDWVAQRSQEALQQHGIIPSSTVRDNGGDLAEATRHVAILELAAKTARSMVTAMEQQLSGMAPTVPSVPAPFGSTTAPEPTKPGTRPTGKPK